MAKSPTESGTKEKKHPHPFRRAVLRGLAVVLPPLLTIVVFLWAWNLIESYVLQPIEGLARNVIVWQLQSDIHERVPEQATGILKSPDGRVTGFEVDGTFYTQVNDGKQWMPAEIVDFVDKHPSDTMPTTGRAYFARYVDLRYLRRTVVIPVFLSVFILVLYLVGKLMAAGVGRLAHRTVESIINSLPVIRNVYSSVKQVTDFVFSEQEIEFNRVVAVEYPRKGIWSVGFVTGESMLAIRATANEPVLSVLMPTSPIPGTGFTVTVLKRETVDLDISIDQAIQFVVSCGVVVPLSQQARVNRISSTVAAAVAEHEANRDGEEAGVLETANGNGNANGNGRSSEQDADEARNGESNSSSSVSDGDDESSDASKQ